MGGAPHFPFSERSHMSKRMLPKRRLENVGLTLTGACVALVALIVVTLIVMVAQQGLSAFLVDGLDFGQFVTGTSWVPSDGKFGALPLIVTSFGVMLLSTLLTLPIALGSAIFVVEVRPGFGRKVFQPLVELLVGIPSVVYGLIGLTVVNAAMRQVFGEAAGTGAGILSGAIVLAVMILPTVTTLSIDALAAVPNQYREGSYALGCTRWQTVWHVVLKSALPSLMTAVILGMTRAFGENSESRREADLLVADPVRAYKEQAESLAARLAALREVELARTDRRVPDYSVEPLLQVKNLSIGFPRHGDVNVVDNVSFDVRPGQCMALVGESGCGKSITTKTIMNLLPDTARIQGEVLYKGQDLLKLSPEEHRKLLGTEIAMVYQDSLSALNPSMLISAQMKQLTSRGGTRSAEELLELVGLDPKRTLESYPHELSGGQCQRVIIAMALTRDPSLVICDEPTTALDVTVQKQVIKLLNDLQKKLGFAMIFVSHDLALVAEVASEITVMYAGQVVESAPTKELLTNPIHEYTQGLLGSVLSIEAHDGSRLHQVPGSVPSPADFPKGDRFAPRSSHPTVGLDVHPVLKPVPGVEHHFVAEIPDEELAKNGLVSRLEVR